MNDFWKGFIKIAESFAERRTYKARPISKLNPHDDSEVWTSKIDGAHAVIDLKRGQKPTIFSHRLSKRTGGPIEYTEKLPHIKNMSKINARLRAETYAVDHTGHAVAPEVVTSILNSGTLKSLDLQKRLGLTTVTALIDIDHIGGKSADKMPFTEKRKLLEDVVKKHPDFILPDAASTPEEKKSLLSRIIDGTHPQTKEGIVVHKGTDYIKAKITNDHDVFVRDIFHEEATTPGRSHMAGGFSYSWTPDGPIAGKVGTGFDHAMKKDMSLNPHKYIGHVAKVKALGISKNQVLLKPSFSGWHVEKNIDPVDAKSQSWAKQTVIVNKSMAKNREMAKELAKQFADRIYTSRETGSSFRFRQKPPSKFTPGTYKTKRYPEQGISVVYGKLKGEAHE